MTFRESKLVLFNADLAGYARATAHLEALGVAIFLDGWYRQCTEVLKRHGGRVVKFMGDGCFATFPEDRCADAVDAALELRQAIKSVIAKHHIEVQVRSSLHLAIVAVGEAGLDEDRRYDVFGTAVNHLFRMGGGGALLISEPVYRQLPSERRGVWQKTKPPATYSM